MLLLPDRGAAPLSDAPSGTGGIVAGLMAPRYFEGAGNGPLALSRRLHLAAWVISAWDSAGDCPRILSLSRAHAMQMQSRAHHPLRPGARFICARHGG